MAGDDGLFQMELNLHPNEASGLLDIGDGALLGEQGWDLGFWAVLDEGEIEDCIAAIGHREGSPEEEGWEIERLHAEATGDGRQDRGRRGDHARRPHRLRLHSRLPLREQVRSLATQARLRSPLPRGRRRPRHRRPGDATRGLAPELRPPPPHQRRPERGRTGPDPTRQAVPREPSSPRPSSAARRRKRSGPASSMKTTTPST